ncbi:MAG: hypothetical protein K8R63_08745 [Bacteroidales bacterium]|nr:hypothetical protein [Bacteroidales bacterium]
MLDTGCWILDAGFWILDTGYWIFVSLYGGFPCLLCKTLAGVSDIK